MLDPRLRAIRQQTLVVFEEELEATDSYQQALDIALDIHRDKARLFVPHILRELEAMQDEIEECYPPPAPSSPLHAVPEVVPTVARQDGAPAAINAVKQTDNGTPLSPVGPPSAIDSSPVAAVSSPVHAVPVVVPTVARQDRAPAAISAAKQIDNGAPLSPVVPPSAIEPSPVAAVRNTSHQNSRRADMSERIIKAREATLQEYVRLLRRGGDALNEALDSHFDRIESLPGDIDAELEAMKSILKGYKAGAGGGSTHAAGNARAPISESLRADPGGSQPRPVVDEGLLTSPYRFVALNDVVVAPEPLAGVDLSKPLPGGYRAVITVDWLAETPLLIGDSESADANGANDKPVSSMKIGECHVIPGSTIRGTLRAALEIVASARLTQINAQAKYGLRDFDHPRIKPREEDQSVLAVRNVKAGWLRRADDGSYHIVPCRDWHLIRITDLPERNGTNPYQWRADWLKLGVAERYAKTGACPVNKVDNKDVIGFDTPKSITFRVDRLRSDGKKILVRDEVKGGLKGHLVFSNRSPAAPSAAQIEDRERRGGPGQPKKYEYVFEEGTGEQVPVSALAWDRFVSINSRVGKNKRKADGSWAILEKCLDANKKKGIPVFYVGSGDDLQIGLTRFFKVQHRYTLGQIRDRDSAHVRPKGPGRGIDFVESLFGYVLEPDEVFGESIPPSIKPADVARRGRIACGFAWLKTETPATSSSAIRTVMAAPRASFAPFYLRGRFKDYSSSDSDTRLAGRKRYLPRYPDGVDFGDFKEPFAANGGNGNRDTESMLKFLQPKAGKPLEFKGDIRLENVTAAEIGAVLWVLTFGGDPNGPCRHMIGRGKPFGAGQMRVERLGLTVVPNNDDPRENHRWSRGSSDDRSHIAKFLDAFEAHMQKELSAWPNTPDMREFLASADPALGKALAADGALRYPELKAFNRIRETCKLSTRFAAPPKDGPDRLLPVKVTGPAAAGSSRKDK